jgi:hypothetical protein
MTERKRGKAGEMDRTQEKETKTKIKTAEPTAEPGLQDDKYSRRYQEAKTERERDVR